jgi:hypothetical protein
VYRQCYIHHFLCHVDGNNTTPQLQALQSNAHGKEWIHKTEKLGRGQLANKGAAAGEEALQNCQKLSLGGCSLLQGL